MNTDTPRTNDAAFMAIHIDGNGVPTEFARQLERELAAVTDQRDRLAEVMTQILNTSMNHTRREMLLEQTLQSLTPNAKL
jgi:K+/H+ antiporter YhaU regulatory subunit KhtT